MHFNSRFVLKSTEFLTTNSRCSRKTRLLAKVLPCNSFLRAVVSGGAGGYFSTPGIWEFCYHYSIQEWANYAHPITGFQNLTTALFLASLGMGHVSQPDGPQPSFNQCGKAVLRVYCPGIYTVVWLNNVARKVLQ